MRKIVFDLGAAVRSEWPWQGKNTKIQALNGKDIDVHHFALSALAGAPWEFDAAWSAPLEARQQSFPSRRPWNPNRKPCSMRVSCCDDRPALQLRRNGPRRGIVGLNDEANGFAARGRKGKSHP